MHRRVADVMTTGVVAAEEGTPFKEIARRMRSHLVSALPVVDGDGRVLGVVSEADLLPKEEDPEWLRPHLLESGRRRVTRSKAEARTAGELMTSPAVTIGPDASLGQAARLMHERGCKRLPVVDASGRLVGMVSRADLLRVFLRPDEDIRREVVEEVLVRGLWVDPGDVSVRVREGVVTLEGPLERRSLVPILVRLVRGVDGVVGVEDRLSWVVDDIGVRPEPFVPWAVLPPGAR